MIEQFELFPEREPTPLERAEVLEHYPETRWVQIDVTDGGEEDLRELAYYVMFVATQDELREWVWNELGEDVRRVFPRYPADSPDPLPGWLYLDYGITLVRADQGPGVPGSLARSVVRRVVGELHRHLPRPPSAYLWAYAIFNGPPDRENNNLIGVAMVGVPARVTMQKGEAGTGPKIATVTRVALNHDLPSEMTYEAASAVYDAAAEEAWRRGYDFLETWIMETESGQSMRYANWSAPGISGTQSRWRLTKVGPIRKDERRGVSEAPSLRKLRWWKRLTTRWPWPPKPVWPRSASNPSAKVVMRKLKGNVGAGDCYKASEVLYHAAGGKRAGLTPMQQRHEGVSHWWVEGPQGEVYDPTAGQFRRLPNYDRARGRGFLTKRASRAARELGREVGLRVNPPIRFTPDEYNYYTNWVLYAVLGKMREADSLMGAYGKHVRGMAKKLVKHLGVPARPVYRGLLIEQQSVPADRLVGALEGNTFVSFSEDKEVACWFAMRDSFVSEFVAQMRPGVVGWIAETWPDKKDVLYHWSWAERFPSPNGVGAIPLWSFARMHPDMIPSQVEWNMRTQKEVILKPSKKPLKVAPVEGAGCPPVDKLNRRLKPPGMNPGDESLRRAEQEYKAYPTFESWVAWLRASRQRGVPLFTAGGVARATGGKVTQFTETPDGFSATVTDAVRPFPARYFVRNEDGDLIDSPWWDGVVEVAFPVVSEEDPVAYFTVHEDPNEPWEPVDAGVTYRFDGFSVVDDGLLVDAFARDEWLHH